MREYYSSELSAKISTHPKNALPKEAFVSEPTKSLWLLRFTWL